MPTRVATPSPLAGLPNVQAQTYTVRAGESLSAIAKKLLGDESRWTELHKANRGIIGSNPDRLSAGMVLKLPGTSAAPALPEEGPVPQPRPDRDTFVRTPQTLGNVPVPQPRPEPVAETTTAAVAEPTTAAVPEPTTAAEPVVAESAAAAEIAPAALPKRWSEKDVEFLARALSAEARGELTKYLATGDSRLRDSLVGIGYVIARKAESMGTGIEQAVRRDRHFLSAWGQGERGNNRQNYREFFKPTHKIANWDELKTIAREALAGADPTGIGPNHYYDTSISAPRWARGPRVETKRIGKIVFVDTNR